MAQVRVVNFFGETMYRHQFTCGTDPQLNLGKIVCIGRNYAAHAAELNNPIPREPLLFIKPASAVTPMAEPIKLPSGRGSCHFEGELALLIGRPLTNVDAAAVAPAIIGLGLALDLTLRDLQAQLKEAAHPWEKAKGFDGACPLSPFVKLDRTPAWNQLHYKLWLNDTLRQHGESAHMLTPITELVAYISSYFTLLPGDVVLTGTPAGVGALKAGDRLRMELENGWLRVDTSIEL